MTTTPNNPSITIDLAQPAVKPKVIAMPKDDPSRCHHRFANGKRCRLPGLDSHFGFCPRHFALSAALGVAQQQSQSDSLDLSADLLPEPSEFHTADEVNRFLARLLTAVAKGRISPRRAAVLAYITNQLLHSHRANEREIQSLGDASPHVIWDVSDPQGGSEPIRS